MKVLQTLNNLFNTELSHLQCLEALNITDSIKFSINDKYPELVVLNYDQVDSPKYEDITRECRSLVLWIDENGFNIISRSFDRFFNYGEEPDKEYDITKMTAYEKIDGSLIGLFYTEKYGWLYRTRSMIMPEGNINGWDLTWKDLIEESLSNYSFMESNPFSKEWTHIFEVVSPENRVVTRYTNREVYLLAVRSNSSGEYVDESTMLDISLNNNWKLPKSYKFNTFSDCTVAAKQLRDLQEGYVLYNGNGVPCVKVKNPAYVAAHHLRGEGLNPKRMMQLIFMNETAEYLSIFPEDHDKFKPYIEANNSLLEDITESVKLYGNTTNQKEFALKVKDLPYSAVLFQSKAKKLNPLEVWYNQKESYKLKVLESYKNGCVLQ